MKTTTILAPLLLGTTLPILLVDPALGQEEPVTEQAEPDDWRGFRGTDGTARAPHAKVPLKWNDDENIVWELELPGPGTSSPIVLGDSVFVTSWSGYGVDRGAAGDPAKLRRHLQRVHRHSGEVLWTVTVEPDEAEDPFSGRMSGHGYASSTPITDGEHVYAFFGKSGVFAFDLDGVELWRSDVGKSSSQWLTGSGSSLALHGELLIVNAADESASVRALRRTTGEEVWKRATPRLDQAHDTPVVVEWNGRTELVLALLGEIWGLDPLTGELRWQVKTKTNGALAPTIVAGDGVVYSIGGQVGKRSYAVALGGEGDVTETHVRWSSGHGSYVPSPLLVGDHLHWVDEGGIAHCVEAATGELVYRERLEGAFYASPVLIGDRIYAVSREEGTFVFTSGPEFEVLAHNRIEADESSFDASPAVSSGQIFLRSRTGLYCIAEVD